MNGKITTLLFALPSLALAACSETAFQDTLGIGKSAPDETKVRTVQPLSVPPDLELRPPAETAANDTTGAPTQPASTPSTALAAPPVDGAPAPGGGNATTGQAPGEKPQARSSFYDIYTRHGISLYHPDGTRKKIVELNRELADKLREEKRRKNPNYGTIFNMGSIWK